MFRVPFFLVVLSVALIAAGGLPSPFGYISSGFRSLAEYKLATTARLASYLVGDHAVKATVDLKVAGEPDDGAEYTTTEEPAAPAEVLQQEVPAQPQLTIASASDEEINNFKKHFSTGYAALDFANQVEKKRLAAAASTKPHYYDAPVLPLPLEHYKDYVTGGETGGSLMRVAVVAQDMPKEFYQHGASPSFSEEQQQQQPALDSKTAAAPTISEDQRQGHIFPYSSWQAAQPSGYSTYPQSTYQLPDAASGDAAETLSSDDDVTVETVSPTSADQVNIVIPGSQFPELSEGAPKAEPVPDTTDATPVNASPETDVTGQQAEPRQRREAAVAEEEVDTTSFHVPGTNLTIVGKDVETYFRYLKKHDVSECLAKIFCLMAARPAAFGPSGTSMTEFFRTYTPLPSHTSIVFYKEASAAGSEHGDCHVRYEKCTMTLDEMKAAFNQDVGL